MRPREEEGGGRNRIGGRKRKARRGRRWRRKTPVTFALLAPTPKHFLWTDRESTRKKHYFREHRSMLSVRPHSHQVQQFLVAEEYTSRRRAPAIGREGEQLTVPVGRSSQAWFCPRPAHTAVIGEVKVLDCAGMLVGRSVRARTCPLAKTAARRWLVRPRDEVPSSPLWPFHVFGLG